MNHMQLFRAVAIAEALSWVGLLIGMYFKYATEVGEVGVKIFGPIHGAIFLVYVALAIITARKQGWTPLVTTLALVASLPPLATAVFERWATSTGKLAEPALAANRL